MQSFRQPMRKLRIAFYDATDKFQIDETPTIVSNYAAFFDKVAITINNEIIPWNATIRAGVRHYNWDNIFNVADKVDFEIDGFSTLKIFVDSEALKHATGKKFKTLERIDNLAEGLRSLILRFEDQKIAPNSLFKGLKISLREDFTIQTIISDVAVFYKDGAITPKGLINWKELLELMIKDFNKSIWGEAFSLEIKEGEIFDVCIKVTGESDYLKDAKKRMWECLTRFFESFDANKPGYLVFEYNFGRREKRLHIPEGAGFPDEAYEIWKDIPENFYDKCQAMTLLPYINLKNVLMRFVDATGLRIPNTPIYRTFIPRFHKEKVMWGHEMIKWQDLTNQLMNFHNKFVDGRLKSDDLAFKMVVLEDEAFIQVNIVVRPNLLEKRFLYEPSHGMWQIWLLGQSLYLAFERFNPSSQYYTRGDHIECSTVLKPGILERLSSAGQEPVPTIMTPPLMKKTPTGVLAEAQWEREHSGEPLALDSDGQTGDIRYTGRRRSISPLKPTSAFLEFS